ncbi:MAG: multiheme c-type cytochrome [Ignavibacteriales bacterium]|nr:multiheme c-type cytochrome [Ignavibacteriales bacterium]
MFRRFTTLVFILALVSTSLFAQTLTVTPYGVTARGVAVSATDIYTYPYSGLTNVGIGTLCYFEASFTGKHFTTPTWTLTRIAPGSKSAIGAVKDLKNDSTQVITFTPDKQGIYEITFTDGAYTGSVTINAAKYVGVYNTVINGVDTKLQCKTCHSDKVADWEGTNHATMFTRAMNGTPGLSGPADHYSASCISCHTTGYDANPTAINDGFDDQTFTFPTVLGAGGYDKVVAAFPAAAQRANIQCETCHGPASGHLGDTSDSRMVATFDAAVCAYCHDSGTHHIFPEQFNGSYHAIAVNESGPGREACVQCHTGKGFAQYADGVPTTDPYFDASYTPITCAACHDPHSSKNEFQLRKVDAYILTANATTPTSPIKKTVAEAGMGTMCLNCHISRTEATQALASSITSRFGPHHGPQGDILLSNNMLELGGVKLGVSNHKGATVDACVRCHMYSGNAVIGTTVMQWGGHSFSMSTHKKGPDGLFLLDADGRRIPDQDNMEACAQCHGSTFGTSFSEVKFFYNGTGDLDNNGTIQGLQDEVAGMIAKIFAQMPKTSTGAMATPSSSWTTTQLKAFWNATTAQEDKSGGIHNPKYVVSALLGAMKSLGIATAVEKEETVPTQYVVYQNYPNPFNPTTNIKFALPNSGHVKLTIYDAIGREVETLVNSDLVAGTHNVEWTAKNMASGIYLYRIEAGNFVKVNKMLLVK